MRGGYRSRHDKPGGSNPPSSKYSVEAWEEYLKTPLQHHQQDEDRLQRLRERGVNSWDQDDAALYDEITQRMEECEDEKRAPLRRELESYFDELHLPPLPPPLAKSSLWLEIQRPCNYDNEDVRPFFVACEEGKIDEIKQWLRDGRKVLGKIGVQDGLACAAKGDQVDVANYLLVEGGASLHGAVVKAACTTRSLRLFELCLQHGYHPNQQIPSLDGHFGTALINCIDDRPIVQLLLHRGADPNLAPFHDNRKLNWGLSATPPMDRTSGLALDLAVKHGDAAIIQMLLEHGADPRYSRPLHGVIALSRDRRAASSPEADENWRPLMESLVRHGADVNATTYGGGTPLHRAVSNKMWDIVEFLSEHGADARRPQPATGLDAFAVAARDAGTPWERTEAMTKFLAWLCDVDSKSDAEDAPPVPKGALENPLVRVVAKTHGKKIGED